MTKEKYLKKVRGNKFLMLELYIEIKETPVDFQIKGILYEILDKNKLTLNELTRFLDKHFKVVYLINKNGNKILKVF